MCFLVSFRLVRSGQKTFQSVLWKLFSFMLCKLHCGTVGVLHTDLEKWTRTLLWNWEKLFCMFFEAAGPLLFYQFDWETGSAPVAGPLKLAWMFPIHSSVCSGASRTPTLCALGGKMQTLVCSYRGCSQIRLRWMRFGTTSLPYSVYFFPFCQLVSIYILYIVESEGTRI